LIEYQYANTIMTAPRSKHAVANSHCWSSTWPSRSNALGRVGATGLPINVTLRESGTRFKVVL
jgi:hypothetical protein